MHSKRGCAEVASLLTQLLKPQDFAWVTSCQSSWSVSSGQIQEEENETFPGGPWGSRMGTPVAKWTLTHSYHFMSQTIITIGIIIIFPALELFLLPYSLWLLNSQLIHLFGQCPLILDTLPFHILPNTSQYTQTHAKRWESKKTNKSISLQFTFKDVGVSLLDLPIALPKEELWA